MGKKKPWVDGLTIGQVLAKTAEKFPEHDALVYPQLGLRMSYQQFEAEVDKAAKGLLALGIQKGEHVAVWATNLPQWAILQFATAKIGAVLVTVNPAYRAQELKYTLEQSDCAALFITDAFKNSNYYEILQQACPEAAQAKAGKVSCKAAPKLRHVVAIKGNAPFDALSWEAMVNGGMGVTDAALQAAFAATKAEEAINIQYTSGTTGFPKAAMLSHRNILLNAFYVTGCQDITEKDRMCIPVPYYHCFSCVMGTLGAVTRGAAMVIPAEYFDPKATLEAMEKEQCTTIYGVPTMFVAMLEHPSFDGKKLKNLRSGVMAGAPCPIELMKKVMNEMGAKEITIAYGQTETSPVLTQTLAKDPIDVRVETVGRALPGIEVCIMNPKTNKVLKDGEQGEICARGHCIMIGYYKNPQATKKTIIDGWIHTGDLGVRRADGNFNITGRIRDMICRGGENIYPREIEELLFTHPQVGQVAVFGVPDEKFGEAVAAWIQLHEGATVTEEDIRQFCKTHIAHYKVPKYVKFVQEFPQTVSGKIQKFKMTEAMVVELGLKLQKTA